MSRAETGAFLAVADAGEPSHGVFDQCLIDARPRQVGGQRPDRALRAFLAV